MIAGIELEKSAVQHMREPCYRMPVAGVTGSECPFDFLQCYWRLDILVVGNIYIVIVPDKIMVLNGPVADGSYRRKQKADQYNTNLLRSVFHRFSINAYSLKKAGTLDFHSN